MPLAYTNEDGLTIIVQHKSEDDVTMDSLSDVIKKALHSKLDGKFCYSTNPIDIQSHFPLL